MNSIEVYFKVLKIEDVRKTNSILKLDQTYKGFLNINTNAVYWEDSGSDQSWVFWVGDTCELVNDECLCKE